MDVNYFINTVYLKIGNVKKRVKQKQFYKSKCLKNELKLMYLEKKIDKKVNIMHNY
jgi:hypothetical protein